RRAEPDPPSRTTSGKALVPLGSRHLLPGVPVVPVGWAGAPPAAGTSDAPRTAQAHQTRLVPDAQGPGQPVGLRCDGPRDLFSPGGAAAHPTRTRAQVQVLLSSSSSSRAANATQMHPRRIDAMSVWSTGCLRRDGK